MVDDLTARGVAVYENCLKTLLEGQHLGKTVAVEPDSGEYAVATNSTDVVRAIRSRSIRGLLFVRRIGPPTAGNNGSPLSSQPPNRRQVPFGSRSRPYIIGWN
jgi:hypothetical protein